MREESLLDGLRTRGNITIAVAFSPPPEEGYAPEFFLDSRTGRPSGFVCGLGKVLADDLGVEPLWVDIPWAHHMEELLSGKVDLLMSYTNTPERALSVEFAGRLLPSDVMVMVPAARPVGNRKELNQTGKRIGASRGSSIIRVARRHFPLASIQEHDEPTEALESGRIDGCVVDAVTKIFMERHPALRLLRNDEGAPVVLAREYGHPAIRPSDPRFLNWIRNWLQYHEAQGTIRYWLDWWRSFMVG